MNAILTAIYALYNANAALKTALPGGLYLELAPQSSTLPYATYFLISGNTDYWLANRLFELVNIQFDIYADTNAKRLTAYAALIAVFDDARPTVTGYSSIILQRSGQQMLRDGDQDQFYRAMISYEGRFLKT